MQVFARGFLHQPISESLILDFCQPQKIRALAVKHPANDLRQSSDARLSGTTIPAADGGVVKLSGKLRDVRVKEVLYVPERDVQSWIGKIWEFAGHVARSIKGIGRPYFSRSFAWTNSPIGELDA